jgi:hypothetical protein
MNLKTSGPMMMMIRNNRKKWWGRCLPLVGVIVFALAVVPESPASSQPAPTEDELERISRELALEAATFLPLRWSPTQFPLRVAFATGEDLKKKTDCADQWQRQYEAYVQFINEKETLLDPTPITSVLDAYAFFGSDAELQALPAYRLEETWISKPGISIQYRIQDRFSHSYLMGYGAGDFIQFGSDFEELTSESLIGCNGFNSVHHLGLALLQSYAVDISGQAFRLFGDQADPTLEWRAHRRLLSAMKRLPEHELSLRQLKSALIQALQGNK